MRQERDLEGWAKETGAWIEAPDFFLRTLERGGEEHRVFEISPSYFKATYPGKYGFSVKAGPVYPGLTPALPLEYLDRLWFANEYFGDSIQLEGVCREQGELVIFTSQPAVTGSACPPTLIRDFMGKLWLKPLNTLAIGHESALCFYRDLDRLAVFDAHPGNVLRDQKNRILPIDLILLKADDALADQLEGAVEE